MGHLKEFRNPGNGNGKELYLSPTIYEEIVPLRVKYVLIYFGREIKLSNTSQFQTPCLVQVDQIVNVRYV